MKPSAHFKTAPGVIGRVKVSYPRLSRVLVPLDFSGSSREALRYAVPVAQKFGARIILLHVLPNADKNPARPALSVA